VLLVQDSCWTESKRWFVFKHTWSKPTDIFWLIFPFWEISKFWISLS